MAKITKEEATRRREEILQVCRKLYQTRALRDITINEIGKDLSFSRTAIYSYFNNKEEVFLALLEEEYSLWTGSLNQLKGRDLGDKSAFASAIATSLDERFTLLKILAVDMEGLDAESRLPHLISLKQQYGQALQAFQELVQAQFPTLSADEVGRIAFAFFPFLYGFYPYTQVTDHQREAMKEAGVPYHYLSPHELIERTIFQLL